MAGRGIQAKVSEPKKEKTPVKESHSSITNVSFAPQSVAGDNSKKYDNKPGNGECLALGRHGFSLHPHLLKDSCVALLKCVKTMSYTDYGDDRYNARNVSSVCSENARRHGAAVGALGMPDLNRRVEIPV